jgi:hypothetical protein
MLLCEVLQLIMQRTELKGAESVVQNLMKTYLQIMSLRLMAGSCFI